MTAYVPRSTVDVTLASVRYTMCHFDRPGPGPAIVFVHGLGNSCANFEALCAEDALSRHCLVAMDLPGCGDTTYPAGTTLGIDHLVDLTEAFVRTLKLARFLLVGASMGGLIGLLYAERWPERLTGFVNVEGNLAPEDCMFSRLVVPYMFAHFQEVIFPEIKAAVAARHNRGYAKHSEVLQRADPRAYYDYSRQLVEYSDQGNLLDRFLALPVRHFIYGSANRGLTYLPRLRASTCRLTEIANADHFLFYDDPAAFARALVDDAEPVGHDTH